MNKPYNTVATIMEVVGIVSMVVGLIAGITLANAYKLASGSFNFGIFLGVFFAFLLIGFLFIGLAEIIKLLDK